VRVCFSLNSPKQEIARPRRVRHNPRHHWENRKIYKTLEEATVREKHPRSSFLAFHTCNDQHEWLILPFGVESNLFKLLCIEVIFIYNILVLDW